MLFFFRFRYNIFYVLYPFVTYLLSLVFERCHVQISTGPQTNLMRFCRAFPRSLQVNSGIASNTTNISFHVTKR
jgi:hypothetical protein